jgi:hypothetical protein
MAELWFMAAGAKHWMNLFEANMQSQPFFISGVGANGEKFQTSMLGMLEPIQLYRYVLPKEGIGLTMKTLGFDKENLLRQRFSPQLWMLRKALGLKDFPKLDLPNVKMPVSTEYLQIIPVGFKEDVERVMQSTGVSQEAI